MSLTLLDLSEAKQKLALSGLTLANPEAFVDVFTGMKTASGQFVTREKALRASGVLACLRILTEDLSTPPLLLKRRIQSGAEDAVNHPLYNLLRYGPNPFQTSLELREHIFMDLILVGRSAVWAQRVNGDVAALWPLRAEALNFAGQSPNGDLKWNYSSPELTRSFTHQDLWRTNMLSSYIVDGRSMVLLAREAVGLLLAAEEQGARLFSNGIQTDIVFEVADEMDKDQKENLRTSLAETYGSSKNAWRALLLEGGVKANKIGLTAQESQYIESRSFQLTEIARVFRIPDVMLGIASGKTATYASAEQFFMSYAKHTLTPWTERIEQTIRRDLILPKETDLFAKHNLNALLRADRQTRYESYSKGISAGFINRQDARSEEDMDVVPGLEKFLIPVNMVVMGPDGMPIPTGPAPGTVPGATPGTAPEKTPPSPAVDPTDIPDDAESKVRTLAERGADNIIRAETQILIKRRCIDNLPWHLMKVAETTGCSLEAARAYSDWRLAPGVDPFADAVRLEAKTRLINLTLEALL
jgi:HK97 family phage portal protein